MEIKVGDKVRVSKDAPRIYTPDWVDEMFNLVLKVTKVEDGNAMVVFAERTSYKTVLTAIPTKYLIKVDAEAKEPKFKVGEIVRYRYDGKLYIVECKTGKYYYALRHVGGDIMMHDVLESDLELVTEPKQEIKVGDVIDTPKGEGTVRISYGDYWVVQLDNGVWYIHTETNMPSAPYTEPTEQTEADANEKLQEEYARFMSEHTRISLADRIEREHIQPRMRVLSQEDFLKDFDPWEHKITPERPTYEVTVDNVTINWQRYEADLAKEIAVKLSKPNENKPGYVADYAVSVAKAVVENLKKK